MNRVGKLRLATATVLLAVVGLTAGLASAGAEPASTSGKKAKFVAKKFKGKWSGTWTNLTFDTSGKASITLKVKGSRRKPVLFGIFKLGGSAFGCESIPPRPVKMKKGKGRNRWNSGGFKAAWNNGKGPIRITYNHRKGTLTGSGVSPCSAAVTYSFTGKMNSRSARATTTILAGGEFLAKSKLTMKR